MNVPLSWRIISALSLTANGWKKQYHLHKHKHGIKQHLLFNLVNCGYQIWSEEINLFCTFKFNAKETMETKKTMESKKKIFHVKNSPDTFIWSTVLMIDQGLACCKVEAKKT